MIKKKIKDNILQADILFIGSTYEEFIEYSKKNGDNDVDFWKHLQGGSFRQHKLLSNGQELVEYVIWMSDGSDLGTLVHEVTHTTIKILMDRGIKVDIENHEIFCYYNEFLFQEIWLKMEKYFKKSNLTIEYVGG